MGQAGADRHVEPRSSRDTPLSQSVKRANESRNYAYRSSFTFGRRARGARSKPFNLARQFFGNCLQSACEGPRGVDHGEDAWPKALWPLSSRASVRDCIDGRLFSRAKPDPFASRIGSKPVFGRRIHGTFRIEARVAPTVICHDFDIG